MDQYCKNKHDTLVTGRHKSGSCKECEKVGQKARDAKPESKAHRKANASSPEGKIVHKASAKVWGATEEGQTALKAARLKKQCERVGITVDHYKSLPKKCSIRRCTAVVPGGLGDWHKDHDKITGKFRGLLCFKHNRQLSDLTLDDLEDLEEYLLIAKSKGNQLP